MKRYMKWSVLVLAVAATFALGVIFAETTQRPEPTASGVTVNQKPQTQGGSNNLLLNPGTGNVGIGTTSPEEKLHVQGQVLFKVPSLPSGPLLRLESDRTRLHAETIADDNDSRLNLRRARVGTTPVINGDTLGQVRGQGFDGNDYEMGTSIRFAVDGNPGIGDMPGRIEFATAADGSNDPQDRMVINSAGNVGIGPAAPSARLHISGGDVAISTQGTGVIMRATNGANCFRLTVDDAGDLDTTSVTCP